MNRHGDGYHPDHNSDMQQRKHGERNDGGNRDIHGNWSEDVTIASACRLALVLWFWRIWSGFWVCPQRKAAATKSAAAALEVANGSFVFHTLSNCRTARTWKKRKHNSSRAAVYLPGTCTRCSIWEQAKHRHLCSINLILDGAINMYYSTWTINSVCVAKLARPSYFLVVHVLISRNLPLILISCLCWSASSVKYSKRSGKATCPLSLFSCVVVILPIEKVFVQIIIVAVIESIQKCYHSIKVMFNM